MLSGVYDYFFGEENSNDSAFSQENVEACSVSSSEDDWCIVEDSSSGRSSPVVVPEPEMRDIDSLSFCSKKSFKPMTAEQIRRSEELRVARAAAAQRMELERALFAEVETPLTASSGKMANLQKSVLISATKLKRATAATLVATDSKTKSRKAKSTKTPANRNNNRKCQNLD